MAPTRLVPLGCGLVATRILSIDGGGIRGLIPARVLAEIERRCGKPAAELFDVIAGTSTGGILALGLACPQPKYSATDLASLYVEEGESIFPKRLINVRQLYDEKYSAEGLERALLATLGDTRLTDARTRVLVTAYDIELRAPVFFRSEQAKQEPGRDFLMRDVARATSAAPTYFEPAHFGEPPRALVDGGVFANNPGMCALVDRDTPGRLEDVVMVSLGTGQLTRSLPYDKAKDWGLLSWGLHVLDVVFDGVSDTVDHQLQTILGANYLRLQTDLDVAKDDMDDAGRDNIGKLETEARQLIADSEQELAGICEKLTA
jgi:predicted acylesterase/phospholipase RssA